MKVRLNNQPTLKQKTLIKKECAKEFNKLLEIYNHDTAIQIMHILHFYFGFGQQRLRKFFDNLAKMQKDQKERYELSESDTTWLCEKQLTQSGIDFKSILGEG